MNARHMAMLAAGLLVMGWFAPAYTISKGLGDPIWTAFMRSVFPELLKTESKSLFDTVVALVSSGTIGNVLLGFVVFVFTFMFPASKLAAILFAKSMYTASTGSTHILRRIGSWCLSAGKWSMLDVFVVAIVLVSLADFKGIISTSANIGILAFCLSAILTSAAASKIKRFQLESKDRAAYDLQNALASHGESDVHPCG